MASQTPKSVALVGRPNVGKSRLFNRILGRRVSIVHDKPGVTRDIVVEKLTDSVALMDTGGLGAVASGGENIIAQATNRQAKFAIDTADTIIFVVDSQDGLTPLDQEIAALLRSSGKDVILAVNKVDIPSHADGEEECEAVRNFFSKIKNARTEEAASSDDPKSPVLFTAKFVI